MKKDILSPYIRAALFDTQTTHFIFNRTIWDYELIYIEEGKMKVTVKNKTWLCEPGDFILLKPHEHHILEAASDKVVQPHVHFDLIEDELSKQIFVPFVTEDKMSDVQKTWFRKDILKDFNIDLPTVIKVYNAFSLKYILFRLIEETTYKKAYSDLMEKSLLIELLSELARSYNFVTQSASVKHYSEMEKMMKYIYDNADKNLSLDDLTEYANLSKFYLSRLFKSAVGTSPYQYITQIRYKRAKNLIQFTNLNMLEISNKMNFPDQQTFSRWFKKLDGYSPIKYRINPK